MSNILNMHHQLMARGQHMLETNRSNDARLIFQKLAETPEVDLAVRVQSLRRIHQIHIQAGKFRQSRLVLRQLMKLQPNNPEWFEAYALNIEADSTSRLENGLIAIRRACSLDRREPRLIALYGRFALALGKRDLADQLFNRVARSQTTCPKTLEITLLGLLQLDRSEDARKLLMNARATADRNSSLNPLWEMYRFEMAARESKRSPESAVILTFPTNRTVPPSKTSNTTRIVRVDRGQFGNAPHFLRRINLSK